MNYRIILANGYVHGGDDERDPGDFLAGTEEGPPEEGLPDGWCWLAGLYVRRDQVVAVQLILPSTTY